MKLVESQQFASLGNPAISALCKLKAFLLSKTTRKTFKQ